MKLFTLLLLFIISHGVNAQYIIVKAKYTETRLVDDSPNPPIRQNRLVLSFFTVSSPGIYVPAVVSNYDIWVYDIGLPFGASLGDSTGKNYTGYAYTAPKVVSYFNTYGINYIDCNPSVALHFVANGHELDCGFITVSYWDIDYGTERPFEAFTAPNVCLPYYDFSHPYYWVPGNINFSQTESAGPPYDLYNFLCAGSSLQLVRRGLLLEDTGSVNISLPVHFDHVDGQLNAGGIASISWSNLTESDIDTYEIQQSTGNNSFQTIGTVLPTLNNGGKADYVFTYSQTTSTALYRIKANELNGSSFYSNILPLKKSGTDPVDGLLTVFPNPVINDHFDLRLTVAAPGRYICKLINSQQQYVRSILVEHRAGDLTRRMDMTGLPAGIYTLVIQSSQKRFTQKIIYVH